MLAKTLTASLHGVSADVVQVEAHVGPGLPRMDIVGLADTAISEARDRIRTAVRNSGLPWPKTRIVVNLAPAHLRKSGAHCDLAICMAVLGSINDTDHARTMFIGELGLDGSVKPCPGVLSMILSAGRAGVHTVIIPASNEEQARLIDAPRVLLADSLQEVVNWANGTGELRRARAHMQGASNPSPAVDLGDIAGQREPKMAAEIAAAGGHHLVLLGPAGSGKSMLASALSGILPPLTTKQQIETTAIHSLSNNGDAADREAVVEHPPLVSPHHSVTAAALRGGGSGKVTPGAMTLAHNGVLFLDEAHAIPARILDQLRIPLESGEIVVHRGGRPIHLPARFQLVIAANPCACGAEEPQRCRCSAGERRRYLSNISGPIRDRIDIAVRTHRTGGILNDPEGIRSLVVRERVIHARDVAAHRWRGLPGTPEVNARVSASVLRRDYAAYDDAMMYLEAYLSAGEISQRGADKVLRLAWTLRDLDEIDSATAHAPRPTLDHVARALEMRSGQCWES